MTASSKGRHCRARRQRGAAAVEFALVLPLLTGLTFGIIEFSVMLFDKAMVTNASREGARLGSVYRDPNLSGSAYPSDGEIQTAALQYVQNNLINLGGTSTPTVSVSRTADRVQVDVNYVYNFFLLPLGSTTIGGTTVMRFE